jgi:hypothetical protein
VTAPFVLAVFAAPGADDEAALEWLRTVAALTGTGRAVRLREAGAGVGVLTGDALAPEAERMVDALADLGVAARPLDDADLVAAAETGAPLLRLGAADRSGVPALVVWEASAPSASMLAAAGQVVRAPPAASLD